MVKTAVPTPGGGRTVTLDEREHLFWRGLELLLDGQQRTNDLLEEIRDALGKLDERLEFIGQATGDTVVELRNRPQ